MGGLKPQDIVLTELPTQIKKLLSFKTKADVIKIFRHQRKLYAHDWRFRIDGNKG